MPICQFPNCTMPFEVKERGCAMRKYCKPHSEIVRDAKKKEYAKKYQEQRQKRTRTIKEEIDMRCAMCNVSIKAFTLSKRYCVPCQKKRNRICADRARFEKILGKAFEKVGLSISNNTNVYMTRGL